MAAYKAYRRDLDRANRDLAELLGTFALLAPWAAIVIFMATNYFLTH